MLTSPSSTNDMFPGDVPLPPLDEESGFNGYASLTPAQRMAADNLVKKYEMEDSRDRWRHTGEPPPVSGPEDYGTDEPIPGAQETPDGSSEALRPAPLISPATWPPEPPPDVDWLAYQRIPRGDVTTLHGDGGAGKTDIAVQLAEGCCRGASNWLGHEIARGPVVIVSAEEPESELRRKIWMHGQRDGFVPQDLPDLHMWFPNEISGATFAIPDYRSGIMKPTPLFRSLEAAISERAPVLVIVDNVAATFAGNQNDRVMVRSYVNLWREIARQPSRPAVVLLDHPSLSGMTNGTGRGGNMDWRNAVRSALYLRPAEDRAEAAAGVRLLETVKSNYGPLGEPVRLKWSGAGLALENTPTSFHRLAKEAECEEIFLRLLDERNAQGRPVSNSPSANYAPTVFAEMADNGGFTKKAFVKAMDSLFHGQRIMVRSSGPPSRQRSHIERAPQKQFAGAAE